MAALKPHQQHCQACEQQSSHLQPANENHLIQSCNCKDLYVLAQREATTSAVSILLAQRVRANGGGAGLNINIT